MRVEAKEMLKNLTSITATKRAALLFCVLVLMAAGVAAQSGSGSGSGSGRGFGTGQGSGSGSGSNATTVFRSARDLITDGDWDKAQAKFDEYLTSFPNEKNIDAALYWKAYADYKLAKYDRCRSALDVLMAKYPNSTWKDDARTLLAQVPGGSAAAYDDMVRVVRGHTVAVAPAIQQTPDTPTATVPPFTLVAPAAPVSQIQGVVTPGAIGFGGTDDADDDDNSNDPCEFKIVVLQALFQTDVQ